MKHKFTLLKKVCSSIVLVALFVGSTATAQVRMGKYKTYYSQNFDGLPNKTHSNWYRIFSGVEAVSYEA
jgi:hypothetical protein